MGKKLLSLLLCLALLLSLVPASFAADIEIVGPGELAEPADEAESMPITVWVSEAVAEQTRARIQKFNATHTPAAPIVATVVPFGESEVFGELAADPDNAADLFIFPQDQLVNIVRCGLLDKLSPEAAQAVGAENAESSVRAAEYHGELYAYPVTADNGYFMYYDKSVIPEADVDSLEALVADCVSAGRTFWFEADSGWYLASFFFGAGCVSEWEPDGEDWIYTDTFNSEQGLIAAKGLKHLTDSSAWMNSSDGGAAFNEGNAAVLISGVWDYNQVLDDLGDNLGATDLPSFTVEGTDYHMGSFSGCKLLGVKPQADADRAAVLHELAAFLSDKDAQLERYDCAAWGPSNLAAQQDPAVQANPALAALLRQNACATPQGQIPGYWWNIATALSQAIRSAGTDEDLEAALTAYSEKIADPYSPDPVYASGECGDDLSWVLDGNTLTISGTGDMWDFYGDMQHTWEENNPWYSYKSSVKNIVIQDGATSIGAYAFRSFDNLESVTIPNGVTAIGSLAFYQCVALTSVTLPESVMYLSDYAFRGCEGLSRLELSEGLLQIAMFVFDGCSSLTSVTIPASVTTILGCAFSNCYSLTEILVAEGSQSFKSEDGVLFTKDGSELRFCPGGKTGEYQIPEGVSRTSMNAFCGCNKLTRVRIPESVTLLGEYSFCACSNLTEIWFSGAAPEIRYSCFYQVTATVFYPANDETWTEDVMQDYDGTITWVPYCASGECGDDLTWVLDSEGTLTISGTGDMWRFDFGQAPWYEYADRILAADLGEGVTSISDYAFTDLSKMVSAALPASLTRIGESAFYACYALESIEIPDAVSEIGSTPFYCCDSLTEILVGEGNAAYSSLDGVLFNKDQTLLICCPGAKSGDYAIPDSVTEVGSHAFYSCAGLTSVTIPDSVTSIKDWAFYGCAGLTTITIPDSVTSIGGNLFYWCQGLESAVIGDGVTELPGGLFSSCTKLKNVTFCDRVTEIGIYAFNHCSSLESITIPETVVSIIAYAFQDCTALTDVYYGGYQEAAVFLKGNGWELRDNQNFFNANWHYAKTLEEGWALCGLNLLWQIDGDGVMTIKGSGQMWDFYTRPQPWEDRVSEITAVSIGDGAESIGYNAFKNCGSLQRVTIPDSVSLIGRSAFQNCGSLTEAAIPEGVEMLPDNTFNNCSSLTHVTLPDSLTFLDDYAFFQCSSLNDVNIPDSVTRFGMSVFGGCSSLTEAKIPDGVTKLSHGLFASCGLVSIEIPESVAVIEDYVFGSCQALTEIRFKGIAPSIEGYSFYRVTATAYYPADNPSWTADLLQNYGGAITWVPYSETTVVAEGRCGEELTWVLDSEGTLTISGTGDMWTFPTMPDSPETHSQPWNDYLGMIQTLVICDGATSIGENAFVDCDRMTSVEIPASVTRVGICAFSNCSSLKTAGPLDGDYNIRFGWTELIPYCAFHSCDSLTSATIPEGVTELGNMAFDHCINLTDVSLPESLTRIGASAFRGCEKLAAITLPKGVRTVVTFAFVDCGSLTEIRFEGPAPSIGGEAFSGVTATAYYPANEPSWTEDVMQDYDGTITWAPYLLIPDSIPLDEEHFPDEDFLAYVAENFDGDGDGALSAAEIEEITEIDVSLMELGSLQGLEYFPMLTVLYCLGNQLTALDVTHNPLLEDLDCSFNSLTALDVSHNPALAILDCSENAITALDVTGNPLLEGLFCYGNAIGSAAQTAARNGAQSPALDLTQNPALIALDCSSNELCELDLSGNPELMILSCYGNDIAELDLSPCPTLVDIVENGVYTEHEDYVSYTKDSLFVQIDPTTKLTLSSGYAITVTDLTKGAASTSLDLSASYSGTVNFTVTSTDDKAVLVIVKTGGDYSPLVCTTSGTTHSFTLTVSADTELVLVLKGDVTMDGQVQSRDGNMASRASVGKYTISDPIALLAADADGNGKVESRDGNMISRASVNKFTLKW